MAVTQAYNEGCLAGDEGQLSLDLHCAVLFTRHVAWNGAHRGSHLCFPHSDRSVFCGCALHENQHLGMPVIIKTLGRFS